MAHSGSSLRSHSRYYFPDEVAELCSFYSPFFFFFPQESLFSRSVCQRKLILIILRTVLSAHKTMCIYLLLGLWHLYITSFQLSVRPQLYRILCHRIIESWSSSGWKGPQRSCPLKISMFAMDRHNSKDTPQNRTKISYEF